MVQETSARRNASSVADAVRAIVVSPEYPVKPHLLVALGDELLISNDAGQSWTDRIVKFVLEHGIACVLAPQGLEPSAPLRS